MNIVNVKIVPFQKLEGLKKQKIENCQVIFDDVEAKRIRGNEKLQPLFEGMRHAEDFEADGEIVPSTFYINIPNCMWSDLVDFAAINSLLKERRKEDLTGRLIYIQKDSLLVEQRRITNAEHQIECAKKAQKRLKKEISEIQAELAGLE